MVMTFDTLVEQLLQEAIPLNIAKQQYTRNKSLLYTQASQVIKDTFGSKDRLIYPIDIEASAASETGHQLFHDIQQLLDEHGYNVRNFSDYIKGVGFQIKNGQPDVKNPQRIGKLLQRFEPESIVKVRDRETGAFKSIPGKPLLHEFKRDPIQGLKIGEKTYLVVISRHPYDIAGMSTDRNWTSCMDLGFQTEYKGKRTPYTGSMSTYIAADVEHGTLIAYLVSTEEQLPNSKVSLRRPISRIVMKPHNATDGTIAYALGQVYGVNVSTFSDFVENWIINNVNKNLTSYSYRKNTNLYDDGGERTVGFTEYDPLRIGIDRALNNKQNVSVGSFTLGVRRRTQVPIIIRAELPMSVCQFDKRHVVVNFATTKDTVADLMDDDISAVDAQLLHNILAVVDTHLRFTPMTPGGTIEVSACYVTITINFTIMFGSAFYNNEEYEDVRGLDVEYATEAAAYLQDLDGDAIVRDVAKIHQ